MERIDEITLCKGVRIVGRRDRWRLIVRYGNGKLMMRKGRDSIQDVWMDGLV